MSNRNTLCVALPKGRLAEETIELFVQKGITVEGIVDEETRKLVFHDEVNDIKFMLVRNTDVPTYVEHGAADLGVVGKDVLMESGAKVNEYLDLGFGYCRLCVAGIHDADNTYRHDLRIASKYANITKDFFAKKGVHIETIKLYGSIELAPIVGLSDLIVDLVSTGQTLKKNGLAEVETIMESTARLVGNRSMAKMKYERIKKVIACLEQD